MGAAGIVGLAHLARGTVAGDGRGEYSYASLLVAGDKLVHLV